MHAVADSASSMVGELAEARNVLLLSSPLEPGDGDACSSLLSAVPDERADVLSVTFNKPPDARMEHWQTSGGPVAPASLGFLVVGENVRSAAVQGVDGGPGIDDVGPKVRSVSTPGDLTGIGIKLSEFFDEWADDGNDLALCFHTLTTFLQYADLRSVYQFVHVLTGRVRARDGRAHYHLDPTAHDRRTVNTLSALFDAVVEREADGEWIVRRRR